MLAAAVSIGLHGFLLTQWPSPVVQVPRWTSAETIRITYLPSPGPPRVDGVSRAAMRRLTPVHAAAASSGQEPRMANPAVPPLPSVAVPAAPPRPAPTVSSPPSSVSSPAIPSLLSPADFARFQYKQVIRERLRQGLRYPEGAGMTARGRVQLTMTLAPDGSVVTASCRSAITGARSRPGSPHRCATRCTATGSARRCCTAR